MIIAEIVGDGIGFSDDKRWPAIEGEACCETSTFLFINFPSIAGENTCRQGGDAIPARSPSLTLLLAYDIHAPDQTACLAVLGSALRAGVAAVALACP